MYPLDRGAWGPTVRIGRLREALSALVELDVIAGGRMARRREAIRYAASGRLRSLHGIYVESSTFLPAESDLVLLGLARARGIPVVTYVRDAYQLFEDYYPRTSLKRRIGARLFRPTIAALRAVSTRLAVPTAGMAGAIGAPDAILLPPGAPPPVSVPTAAEATELLFVGDARMPAHSAGRLVEAVALVRAGGSQVRLTIVTRPGQEPPGDHPEWLRIHHAEGEGIHALLGGVLATVVPRPRNAYNDLALPIKLFEYLSYGRPVLVTDCVEQARVVREADAGLVVSDDAISLAEGIRRIERAPAAERARLGKNAHAAATEASWERRAASIVRLFDR